MNTTTCRRIAAHYTYYRRTLVRNTIVSWSSDGIVTDISQCENIDSQPNVEFYNGILIPDLVNAHCHLELSYMHGAIPQGGGFVEFAKELGRYRAMADQQQRLLAAEAADGILWRQGVGAVGDISNGDDTFPVKVKSPVRYVNFLELFGLDKTDAKLLLPLLQSAKSLTLKANLSPHSVYSLNDAAFKSVVALSDRSLPLSIHFMESDAESELYNNKGEMAEWYGQRGLKTDFTSYGSPALRIVNSIPPDMDVMLIHNTCVTPEVVDMIQAHFKEHVFWVLCPRSNNYISNAFPPVELLRERGCRIAIGTDSLSSNTSLSMLDELKMFPNIPLEELLAWATVNGAEALGLKGTTGEFEVGQKSGAVLLTGVDWNEMRLTEHSETRRVF